MKTQMNFRVEESIAKFLDRCPNKTALVEIALRDQIEKYKASLSRVANFDERTIAREKLEADYYERYADNADIELMSRNLNFVEIDGEEIEVEQYFQSNLFDCESQIDVMIATQLIAEEMSWRELTRLLTERRSDFRFVEFNTTFYEKSPERIAEWMTVHSSGARVSKNEQNHANERILALVRKIEEVRLREKIFMASESVSSEVITRVEKAPFSKLAKMIRQRFNVELDAEVAKRHANNPRLEK